MNSRTLTVGALSALVVALPLGAEVQSRVLLQPTEHCRDHSPAAIATFADPDLEEVVRGALSLDDQEDLTCGRVSELSQLTVGSEQERVVYGGTLRFDHSWGFTDLPAFCPGSQSSIWLPWAHNKTS